MPLKWRLIHAGPRTHRETRNMNTQKHTTTDLRNDAMFKMASRDFKKSRALSIMVWKNVVLHWVSVCVFVVLDFSACGVFLRVAVWLICCARARACATAVYSPPADVQCGTGERHGGLHGRREPAVQLP